MKANEVRKMSGEELQTKLQDLKKDLFNLRLQHATNQLDNPMRLAAVKKDIARIKKLHLAEEQEKKLIKDAEKLAREQEEQEKKEAAAKAAKEHKKYGFISVSVGEGLSTLFKELNVDYIIEGGQTMNPSTEDILEAVDKVNAKNIFVLPNNGNIILAAEQAKQLTEDKNLIVIPSKNIPQGISAMINFVGNKSVGENEKNMSTEMLNIKSGQVTYAVRDTNMDGKDIKQGDFMGLTDKTIVAVEKNVDDATKALIAEMIDDDAELVSIYYGADVTEEDAEALAAAVGEKFADLEVELQMGGQPVYYYIASVE